jgi:Family of unknown function (DUF5329)
MILIGIALRRWLVWLAAWFAALSPGALFAEPAPAEMQRIESLLTMVAKTKDARFVRNGSDYSGGDAADFLRGKLRAMGKDVDTAEVFIDRIATKSSTTGRPYRVRFVDGREVNCADFLRAELARQANK